MTPSPNKWVNRKNTINFDFGYRVFHDRIMEHRASLTSIQENSSISG